MYPITENTSINKAGPKPNHIHSKPKMKAISPPIIRFLYGYQLRGGCFICSVPPIKIRSYLTKIIYRAPGFDRDFVGLPGSHHTVRQILLHFEYLSLKRVLHQVLLFLRFDQKSLELLGFYL